jgi:hypothetical protein
VKLADGVREISFLEQADGGDSGCAGFEAGASVR